MATRARKHKSNEGGDNERKLAQLMKLLELGAIELPDVETDGKGVGFYADDLKPAKFSPELLKRLKAARLLNMRALAAPSVTLGKLPESAIVPVDKVTKKVWEKQDELFGGQSLAVDVARRSKKRVSASHKDIVVSLDLDNLEGVEILRKLTEFDRAVMNAVITLNVAGGRDVITPAMVYKILNPATTRYPSGKMVEQIGKSLDALMFTPVVIHIPGDYMPDGKPRDLKAALVPAKRLTSAVINGKAVDDPMQLYETPPLYVYADGMGQIARPSLKALAVPINMNADNVALKSYLTRRVWEMKRAKSNAKVPKTILWETVYKNMGVPSGTTEALKKKRGRIRATALQILDYWRDCGEIHGYEETTKGRAAYSVQIKPVYI